MTDALESEPFSYRAADGGRKVMIDWQGRQVMVVAGEAARKLLARIEGAEPRVVQLALAKITGNFKRGNERAGRKTR